MTVLSSLLHWTEISLEGPHPPKDRRGRTLLTVHERQTVHTVLAGTVSGLFGFRRDGPRVKRGRSKGKKRGGIGWDVARNGMAVPSGIETIDDACLAHVLCHLDADTLLETAMASPRGRWTRVMRRHGVWKDAFARRWKVDELLVDEDTLERAAFYLHATLDDFRTVHELSRCDTLASVAVRHGVGCATIKSSNNLFSDQSLHCRSKVYIPIQDESQLFDTKVKLVRVAELKRYLLLVVEPAASGTRPTQQNAKDVAPRRTPDSKSRLELLAETMHRSMRVDLDTCRYYLLNNRQDLARAMGECQEDADWETKEEYDGLR